MRAIRVEQTGGAEVLHLADVPEPEPQEGAVVVEVLAAGVNFIDVYYRNGTYPLQTPFTLGQEGAGVVTAVGAGVDSVAVGDTVAWKAAPGSYAEKLGVPAREAVPVPAGVEPRTAAALLLQGVTAHYLATSTYPVQPGDWAIVHAGAGGVGLLLTQIVKLRAGQVLATTSSQEKAALAREAGADEVASYDDFAARARELTDGEGVAVVYDGVGRATFDGSLDALRIRGLLALYGAASGQVPPVDLQVLNRKGSLFVTRPTIAHYTRTHEELVQRTDELFSWLREGDLQVRIGAEYPLEQARRAHEDLEGRRTTGKLLLIP